MIISAWSVGGHHISTFDGLTYTFNGVGEYVLVDTIRLKLQGRMTLISRTNTTQFSTLVIQYDTNRVQVQVSIHIFSVILMICI